MNQLEKSIQEYFSLDTSELSMLANQFEKVSLKKGRFLTHSGQICDRLAFVQSGLLRVYFETDKKEVTQWISTPGTFATELSGLLFQKPSRWNIEALEDCELYVLDKDTYHNLPSVFPKWSAIEKAFIGKCFTMIEDRVFSFLSMSAEQRFQMLFELYPDLFLKVQHQYLASMIGMSPETFSRMKHKLIS